MHLDDQSGRMHASCAQACFEQMLQAIEAASMNHILAHVPRPNSMSLHSLKPDTAQTGGKSEIALAECVVKKPQNPLQASDICVTSEAPRLLHLCTRETRRIAMARELNAQHVHVPGQTMATMDVVQASCTTTGTTACSRHICRAVRSFNSFNACHSTEFMGCEPTLVRTSQAHALDKGKHDTGIRQESANRLCYIMQLRSQE